MSGNHNNCGSCHQDDCSCDNVVSREIIDNDPEFEVVVDGDYEASTDDGVVRVLAGQIVDNVVVVPVITLADPTETTAPITIIAKDGNVTVKGLKNDGTFTVLADSAVTFWPVENKTGKCECPSGYWVPECCGLLT